MPTLILDPRDQRARPPHNAHRLEEQMANLQRRINRKQSLLHHLREQCQLLILQIADLQVERGGLIEQRCAVPDAYWQNARTMERDVE